MKTYKKTSINCLFLIPLLAVLLLAGCRKAPIDRNIEGMWMLEEFTTHADGTVHKCERLYYSIQLWAVEVSEKQGNGGYGTFIGRFSYGENHETVTMKDFKDRYSTTGNNDKDAPLDSLKPYGIGSLETTFKVLKADGKSLILESDYATLRLKSF